MVSIKFKTVLQMLKSDWLSDSYTIKQLDYELEISI